MSRISSTRLSFWASFWLILLSASLGLAQSTKSNSSSDQVSAQTPRQDPQASQIANPTGVNEKNSQYPKGGQKKAKRLNDSCASRCDDLGNVVLGLEAPPEPIGIGNTFVGLLTGLRTKGVNNSFFGREAGENNTQGGSNSFFGAFAGGNNVNGTQNSFFGFKSGLSNTSENNNTFIGSNSNGVAGITNATAVGANASVACSNCLVLGSNANVGINTANPANSLTVNGNASFGGVAANAGSDPIELQGPNAGISLWDRTGGAPQRWIIYSDRDVHGAQNLRIRTTNLAGNSGPQDVFSMNPVGTAGFNGVVFAGLGFVGTCFPNGVVGNGNCHQDLAESFATREQTQPGDVVTLIPRDHAKPTVRKSLGAYDEHLLGVVSTNPGLIFDDGETRLAAKNEQMITKEKTAVAVVGRVPVRFTLENGAIEVGEPLTSSATVSGAAMKATQAGKIIGYALESSAKGKDGKLLMLMQVGYYVPPRSLARMRNAEADDREVAALKEQNQTLQLRHAELDARLTALEQAMQQMKEQPQAQAQLSKRQPSNK